MGSSAAADSGSEDTHMSERNWTPFLPSRYLDAAMTHWTAGTREAVGWMMISLGLVAAAALAVPIVPWAIGGFLEWIGVQ
jgi:hypothetical protein